MTVKPCPKCEVLYTGKSFRCRPCTNAYMREYEQRPHVREKRLARYRKLSSDIKLGYSLKRFYGMPMSEYQTLRDQQGGVCAGCQSAGEKSKRKGLFVDHDHTTNRVRGLLCNQCNVALGLLNDDLSTLDRLAAYLRSKKEL